MGFITNIFTTFLKIIGGYSSTEKKLQLFDVEEYTPPHPNYKKCPNCVFESHTNEEIRRDFSVMHKENYSYIQSWCRECRKGHTTKKRRERKL